MTKWLALFAAVVIGVLVFGFVYSQNEVKTLKAAAEEAAAKAKRDAEAADLKTRGIQAASEETQAQMQAEIEGWKKKNDALGMALSFALQAAPGSKPIATFTGSTGPLPGKSGPAATPPSGGTATVPPATVTPPPVAGGPVCMFYAGNQGEIRVPGGAVFRTEAVNHFAVAEAEAWRLNPDAMLFGGQVKLDLKLPPPPPPERKVGWGAGAVLAVSGHGWTAGPAVAPPPWEVFRLQVEPIVGLSVGSGGEWSATGTLLGRWK